MIMTGIVSFNSEQSKQTLLLLLLPPLLPLLALGVIVASGSSLDGLARCIQPRYLLGKRLQEAATHPSGVSQAPSKRGEERYGNAP